MPEISVITVCYNSEKTIERTLKSMLVQKFTDYEYIIIDGNSKDSTLDIVNKYIPLFEGRLKVYSEPDQGIYDAMNKGINKACGTLIGMVNSDDYYEPDALANIHKAFCKVIDNHGANENSHYIFYGMERRLRNGEEVCIEFNHDRLIGESIIYHPPCFISKSVYDDFGKYDLQYKSAADLDFLIRIKQTTDTFFIPVYEIISNFEVGGTSSSGLGSRESARIRYRYGIYSKTRKNYVIIESLLVDFVHMLKRTFK